MARIPRLGDFTDEELALALSRLPVSRLKTVVVLLWARLSAEARKTLIDGLRAAPDFGAAVMAHAAGNATRSFLSSLITPTDES